MAFWLFKSEPGDWSWEMQKQCGEVGTEWTGVRNFTARNFLQSMSVGDRGFFYHSGREKKILGIVEVCGSPHTDPTAEDPRWVCVDVRAVCSLPRPVSLAEVKAEKDLQNLALVRLPRLSVQPVSLQEWKRICAMGGRDETEGF